MGTLWWVMFLVALPLRLWMPLKLLVFSYPDRHRFTPTALVQVGLADPVHSRPHQESRNTVEVLYHATGQSNAEAICSHCDLRPGGQGFLGSGIYFSKQSHNARRY